MKTATTKYADTFWDSPDPESITTGQFVDAGTEVIVVEVNIPFATCQFVDSNGNVWHKQFASAGLNYNTTYVCGSCGSDELLQDALVSLNNPDDVRVFEEVVCDGCGQRNTQVEA